MRCPALLSLIALLVSLSFLAQAAAAGLRCPVTRDTWVSEVGRERDGNNGGATRLKTKGIQEFAIVDLDPAPLRGRIITRATLHLHVASSDIQRRLTISTLSSDWTEGTGTSYAVQAGSASFNWARQDRAPWAWRDSDILAVMNGAGGSIWRFADATPPDKDGWQSVAVDPAVVAARVAGISFGFVVFDDVGSEYERNGDAFKYLLFRNRFLHSREQGARFAPYFTIELGREDKSAPAAPSDITATAKDLPSGEAMLTWTTPRDSGPAGVIGFAASLDDGLTPSRPIPQYLVPPAGKPGEPVNLHLRDLALKPGATVRIGIRAVDAAGNTSPPAVAQVSLSNERPFELAAVPVRPLVAEGELPGVGPLKVAVIDALDKVNPVSGEMIPPHEDGYRRVNHLWSAQTKTIRLHAARNEHVDFQIVLEGQARDIDARLNFAAPSPLRASLHRFRHVSAKPGPLPDPLVPLTGPLSIPAADEAIAGQKLATLLGEIYVPRDARAGDHRGTLTIGCASQKLDIAIELRIWDFTLPDHLSFIPEMNCYGLPDPPAEVGYYRLAHAHRTCLNRLGYNWRGQINSGCAPRQAGDDFDWTDYDRRFGPLLNGSAFADLPRGKVPVESFYLPLNENWPADVNRHFKGGYWIESAFTADYWRQFKSACANFAAHFASRGWNDTLLEFYLNNKVYHKQSSWSRSSAPWIFDEPTNTQDFWALRHYGWAFHEAVAPVRGKAQMAFRCDISRPQWQRELLDGLLDVNIVGGAMRSYLRMVMDRKARYGEVVINYGSSNAVEDSNVQPAGWCIDTWCAGGDGVLPWQTVGNEKSWTAADPLSLFYPGGPAKSAVPVPSIRLKAYRRGQQDVEYLTILQQATGRPRHAVASAVREALKLHARTEQRGEDAGLVSFARLDPQTMWSLRLRVGNMLDQLKPPAKAKWVDFRPPVRDVSKLRPADDFLAR